MTHIDVYQDDMLVGSLPRPQMAPRDFFRFAFMHDNSLRLAAALYVIHNPLACIRTTDMRVDWRYDENGWVKRAVLIADPSLGQGDLALLDGFILRVPETAELG